MAVFASTTPLHNARAVPRTKPIAPFFITIFPLVVVQTTAKARECQGEVYDDAGHFVTANLGARITQHREGHGSEFCRDHGLVRLVYIERHEEIEFAIQREKQMKAWKRQWKLRLIRKANPYRRDLYEDLNA